MSERPPLAVIAAISENHVIGHRGGIPWRLAADFRRFRKLTMGHHIIMGRGTYDSLGRCLDGRTTVVVTRQADWTVPGAVVVHDFDAALAAARTDDLPFVIGGQAIFEWALPRATRLYLTRVHATVEGDTFFPAVDWNNWQLVESQAGKQDKSNQYDFTFETYHCRSP